MFNLRRDSYDWLLDHVFMLVPSQAYVRQFLAPVKAFPPHQRRPPVLAWNRRWKKSKHPAAHDNRCDSLVRAWLYRFMSPAGFIGKALD